MTQRRPIARPTRSRYRKGEALIFGSHFMHSTEPGASAGGADAPQVYLCFTFGSDKREIWPHIAPTISGYQSRMLCDHSGQLQLTELGKFIEQGGIEQEERLAEEERRTAEARRAPAAG